MFPHAHFPPRPLSHLPTFPPAHFPPQVPAAPADTKNTMAITGNSSYIPTINEFLAHWTQANAAYTPDILVARLPDNTTRTEAQFTTLRDDLQAQQNAVQSCLGAQQIARGAIRIKKTALLETLNNFIRQLDAYFQNTDTYAARPYAPSLSDGQETFTRPLADTLSLWEKINTSPAPAGVTLPLTLSDGTTFTNFTEAYEDLLTAYAQEQRKTQDLTLARAKRNRIQNQTYEVMKAYREAIPARLTAHPDIIETLPRLTPLPGHTPIPVSATAEYVAPNQARITYTPSADPDLHTYELRANIGETYHEEDAIVIATNTPNAPREFLTTFGLNQPGAQIALKVYVTLTTGNESGSPAMQVARPTNVQLMAA